MINTLLILAFLLLIQHVEEDSYTNQRLRMVRYQIENRGISDNATLEAMRKVKRHLFVPKGSVNNAYDDRPLSFSAS